MVFILIAACAYILYTCVASYAVLCPEYRYRLAVLVAFCATAVTFPLQAIPISNDQCIAVVASQFVAEQFELPFFVALQSFVLGLPLISGLLAGTVVIVLQKYKLGRNVKIADCS